MYMEAYIYGSIWKHIYNVTVGPRLKRKKYYGPESLAKIDVSFPDPVKIKENHTFLRKN